jgi:hypothetical protein
MFFKSAEHKQRFITVMQEIGKIYDGKLDEEYGAAIYILTADAGTWKRASDYVDREGIDIEKMLKDVDFSHGYELLVKLAGNLFNGHYHIDPVDFMILDEGNFNVALTALQIRRYNPYLADLTKQKKTNTWSLHEQKDACKPV